MNNKLIASIMLTSFSSILYASESYDLLTEQAEQVERKKGISKRQSNSFAASLERNSSQGLHSKLVDSSKDAYMHPVLGTPQFFWASDEVPAFETSSKFQKIRTANFGKMNSKQMNVEASKYYLNAYKDMLMGSGIRQQMKFDSATQAGSDKPIHAHFRQYVNNIPVLGGGIQMLMNKDRKLVSVNSMLVSLPQKKILSSQNSSTDFQLSAEHCLGMALEDLTKIKPEVADISHLKGKKYQFNGNLNGWRMVSDANIEKVYYPQKNNVIPGCQVSIRLSSEDKGTKHFGLIFSAKDGKLLQRKNYSREYLHEEDHEEEPFNGYEYRVFADWHSGAPQDGPDGNEGSPHPVGKPNGYQAPVVAPELIYLENAGIHTNDPWLPKNATATIGNNVDAYLDLVKPDGFNEGDHRAEVQGGISLDYFFDGTADANANDEQKSAAVTNLFYTINYLHDVFYDAGFDEASGNAQHDNFGRGGKDKDRILAEGQDFSGTNNANMSTPPDGQSPIMQQYLFIKDPVLTSKFSGIGEVKITLDGTRLGLTEFDVQQTEVILAKTEDERNTLCEPLKNFADITNKVLIGSYDPQDCDAEKLAENLQKYSPKALIIIDPLSSLNVSRKIGKDINYGITRTDGDSEDFIAKVNSQKVMANLKQEADNIRDSTVSNSVVMHEWGHYLHERLAGNGEGLGASAFAGALAEGYGDFVALLHQVREDDKYITEGCEFFDFGDVYSFGFDDENASCTYTDQLPYSGVYPQGGWVDGSSVRKDNQAYYFGIRRVPYSVDKSKNAMSYRHLRPGENLPPHPIARGATKVEGVSPHQGGEIWASALFEAFIGMARDDERLSLDDARQRMRQYLVGGLKMTPSNPTFLMARDAIIAAAQAYDINDAQIILQAFANRGMGTKAGSPPRSTREYATGLVESNSTAPAAAAMSMTITDIEKQCDNDEIWDEGEAAKIKLRVKNSGLDSLAGGKLLITSDADINNAFVEYSTLKSQQSQEYEVSVTLNKFTKSYAPVRLFVADENDPDQKMEFEFFANYDIGASNRDTFEQPNNADSVFNNWTIARNITPEGGRNLDDTWSKRDISNSVRAFIYPFASNLDEVLVTAPFKVSTSEALELNFQHHYTTRPGEAGGVVEIKANGGEWSSIDNDSITQFNADGSILTEGYDGEISNSAGTLIDGQAAFSGENQTEDEANSGKSVLKKVRINFGKSYAGQQIQMRFRFVSAPISGEADDLWAIDDVAFTGVAGAVFDKTIISNVKSCASN